MAKVRPLGPSDAPPVRPRAVTSLRSAPHAVRIIGGDWKRTLLPVADLPGLRPTPDRVRETLFNWLLHQFGGDLAGRSALDLFAGTGALGLEAASRGAGRVLMAETHPKALSSLRAVCDRLRATNVELRQMDAVMLAKRLLAAGERFDMIFLDPPFNEGWLQRMLPLAAGLLTDAGRLYVETGGPLTEEDCAPHGLGLVRADKAGQVFYHLLRRKTGDTPGEDSPC